MTNKEAEKIAKEVQMKVFLSDLKKLGYIRKRAIKILKEIGYLTKDR